MGAAEVLDLVGSKLAALSKTTGLTQEEVARRCQISRITVNRFFKGRTEIRSGDLVHLLSLFGIDLIKILDERIQGEAKNASVGDNAQVRELQKALEKLSPEASKTILSQIQWWNASTEAVPAQHVEL